MPHLCYGLTILQGPFIFKFLQLYLILALYWTSDQSLKSCKVFTLKLFELSRSYPWFDRQNDLP